jgi:hypothetical protein
MEEQQPKLFEKDGLSYYDLTSKYSDGARELVRDNFST